VVAQETFSIAQVFAWTLVLVAILLCSQFIVTSLERRALHWRDV
jgi:NitT/TauT family transport system permease protein